MGGMQRVVVIGGSAGSFQGVVNILRSLPRSYPFALLLCLHRLKHVRSGFVEALSLKSNLPVVEPCDKDIMRGGVAYLAPANYHMLVEFGNKIVLSTEAPVHHSRPSIDLTFYAVSRAYRNRAVGVLLSGANRDGALGMARLKAGGGYSMVQDPALCDVPAMTRAALAETEVDMVGSCEMIVARLNEMAKEGYGEK